LKSRCIEIQYISVQEISRSNSWIL